MNLFSLSFYFYVFIKPDPANATELITKHSYKPKNVIIMDWLSGKVVFKKTDKEKTTTESIHKGQ